jgi:hypothetical protein
MQNNLNKYIDKIKEIVNTDIDIELGLVLHSANQNLSKKEFKRFLQQAGYRTYSTSTNKNE